ncbi:putative 3-hydroxyacyl-CoA dehydrogenase, partial [Aureobasidium melanogenum]
MSRFEPPELGTQLQGKVVVLTGKRRPRHRRRTSAPVTLFRQQRLLRRRPDPPRRSSRCRTFCLFCTRPTRKGFSNLRIKLVGGLTMRLSVRKEPNIDTSINVNLKGPILFSRLASVYLRQPPLNDKSSTAAANKSLTLVSSVAGFTEAPGLAVYSSGKHGVYGLMRALRKVLIKASPNPIRTNAICPWMTETRMVSGIEESWKEAGLPRNKAIDVARVITGVMVAESLNGEALYVEGGRAWGIEEEGAGGFGDRRELRNRVSNLYNLSLVHNDNTVTVNQTAQPMCHTNDSMTCKLILNNPAHQLIGMLVHTRSSLVQNQQARSLFPQNSSSKTEKLLLALTQSEVRYSAAMMAVSETTFSNDSVSTSEKGAECGAALKRTVPDRMYDQHHRQQQHRLCCLRRATAPMDVSKLVQCDMSAARVELKPMTEIRATPICPPGDWCSNCEAGVEAGLPSESSDGDQTFLGLRKHIKAPCQTISHTTKLSCRSAIGRELSMMVISWLKRLRMIPASVFVKATKLKTVAQIAMTNMTEMYMLICEPGSFVQNCTQRSVSRNLLAFGQIVSPRLPISVSSLSIKRAMSNSSAQEKTTIVGSMKRLYCTQEEASFARADRSYNHVDGSFPDYRCQVAQRWSLDRVTKGAFIESDSITSSVSTKGFAKVGIRLPKMFSQIMHVRTMTDFSSSNLRWPTQKAFAAAPAMASTTGATQPTPDPRPNKYIAMIISTVLPQSSCSISDTSSVSQVQRFLVNQCSERATDHGHISEVGMLIASIRDCNADIDDRSRADESISYVLVSFGVIDIVDNPGDQEWLRAGQSIPEQRMLSALMIGHHPDCTGLQDKNDDLECQSRRENTGNCFKAMNLPQRSKLDDIEQYREEKVHIQQGRRTNRFRLWLEVTGLCVVSMAEPPRLEVPTAGTHNSLQTPDDFFAFSRLDEEFHSSEQYIQAQAGSRVQGTETLVQKTSMHPYSCDTASNSPSDTKPQSWQKQGERIKS